MDQTVPWVVTAMPVPETERFLKVTPEPRMGYPASTSLPAEACIHAFSSGEPFSNSASECGDFVGFFFDLRISSLAR